MGYFVLGDEVAANQDERSKYGQRERGEGEMAKRTTLHPSNSTTRVFRRIFATGAD
jgi:hypothetical protein